MNIHERMARAFAEIESAPKDRENQHFRSKYADLSSVVSVIKPALVANELYFVQRTAVDREGVIVTTTVYDAAGASVELGELFVPANRNDAQGFGSALTYARRYALMTAFGVCPEDDDGNAASQSVVAGSSNTVSAKRRPNDGRHAAKQYVRELTAEIYACADSDTLDALLAAEADSIARAKAVIPSWFSGGRDIPDDFDCIDDLIAKARNHFSTPSPERTEHDAI